MGQVNELKKHLALADKRAMRGSNEQMAQEAREGLACMLHTPQRAFKCGPYAVDSILRSKGAVTQSGSQLIAKAKSSKNGTNLQQVKELAEQAGLHYQAAKRSRGAAVLVPSIVHWKLDHFGALTARANNHYQVKDQTFGVDGNLWVTSDALDSESDGYCLVPAGPLPAGWRGVSDAEAQKVWGKGGTSQFSDANMASGAPNQCPGANCGCGGMARASIWSEQGNLNISDTPLSYSPPIGPSLPLHLNYNYLETNQPATFTFSNFGADWSYNWVSYLTVDPVSSVATVRIPGGGAEVCTPDPITSLYPPALLSHAVLVNEGSGVYQRQMTDGSTQIFSLSDGSSPPRIFMTEVVDPQGNSALIQYDVNFRITSITDAINQVTTVSYVSNTVGNSGFYKVSQITDPFSRSASFTYDPTNTELLSITDVLGLTSQFIYDSGSSFISAMTTPYGTTSFHHYVPGVNEDAYARGLRFAFPDGTTAVLEAWIGEIEKTYFWDREATQQYPNDPGNQIYSHCKTTTWMFYGPTQLPVVHEMQQALESPATYYYPGEVVPGSLVSQMNTPSVITRPLQNAVYTATVGGSVTTGNVLYLEVVDSHIPYSTETVNYTVQA
ncbi:MAG: cysteine peptidase family C39 domain-containing protein, partial [Ktedonobacteraceae bacterium]